ncbi:MAG: hypothetical protein A3H97_24920 [Acidobacteria bacterium RIFCSPLOWO2_02_FULL_65_29]|nr:MAG: hypothetical protein A3H97_24920 [Acidobacteria bacterium RIFCSPLOWO2_02_FULL_65_29]
MRFFKTFLFLAALGAAVGLSGGWAGAQAPQFHQEVKVRGAAMAGSTTDAILTFSGPFSVPGVSLAQGTYVFSRPSAGVLQVLSADREQVYTQTFTIQLTRATATDDFEVRFAEPSVVGAPQRVVAWFAPGARVGQELIYYKRQAAGGESH